MQKAFHFVASFLFLLSETPIATAQSLLTTVSSSATTWQIGFTIQKSDFPDPLTSSDQPVTGNPTITPPAGFNNGNLGVVSLEANHQDIPGILVGDFYCIVLNSQNFGFNPGDSLSLCAGVNSDTSSFLSDLTVNGLNFTTLQSSFFNETFDNGVFSQGTFTITAVPEPSEWALLVGAVSCVFGVATSRSRTERSCVS